MLYFAYGSNLNHFQMKRRCKDSISKSYERKLVLYEYYPILYKKMYFLHYGKKIMTYTMTKKTKFAFPTERYLNVIKRGYKDCKLNQSFLIKALKSIK